MSVSDESLAYRQLVSAGILERARSGSAVVLERLAYGGGATNWFYCSTPDTLTAIAARLRHGSSVTFYFDGRIRACQRGVDVATEIDNELRNGGEVVIGLLRDDGIEISMSIETHSDDVRDILQSQQEGQLLFWGAYPARDDDGVTAITLVMADADGVVRRHPH